MVYQSKEKIKYICIIKVDGKNGAICELQKLLDSIISEYENPSKNININSEIAKLQFILREITEKDYSVLKDSELLKLCQKPEIYDNTETWIVDDDKRKIKIKECDFNQVKKENFKIIINVDYSPNMKSEDFSGKFEDMCDPLFMQYLLLLVQKLEKNKFKYLVLVRDSSSEKQERNDHYFQIRQSLRIYHEKFSKIIDCFFYKDGEIIKRIYAEKKKKKEYFGRIFPFIPLTIDIYGDLVRIKDNDGESVKILKGVYDDFLADFKDSKKKQQIESECLSDNLLTKFLFIYTLHYMQDSNEWKSVEKKLHIIHEVCADYAEGVQQLIENAIVHSIHKISESSQDGCGVFTIRIRKKEDSKYLSDDVKDKNIFKYTQFFMELYVTDLSYVGDYKGIVEKFKENVKNRDVKGEYKDKFKDLKLAELFGAERSEDLDNYYNNAKNIAFHFGLQILANTVESSKGYMFVRSGNEDKNKSLCVYENDNKILEKRIYKISNNFEWHDGTAYIIYLPIALREISNLDIPAVEINNDTEQGKDENIVDLFDPQISEDKDVLEEIRKIVKDKKTKKKEKLVEIMTKILSNKKCKPGVILVIDCSQLDKIIEDSIENAGKNAGKEDPGHKVGKKIQDILNQLSQYNLYEILAKAIFRFIAEKPEQKRTIAVINVCDRYEVIHLLRQFMLFYRRGKSKKMKGHSIFIVDKEAELDVLLFDSIDRMAESMYTSQLTGGLDGRAMEIIKYFAKSRMQKQKAESRENSGEISDVG